MLHIRFKFISTSPMRNFMDTIVHTIKKILETTAEQTFLLGLIISLTMSQLLLASPTPNIRKAPSMIYSLLFPGWYNNILCTRLFVPVRVFAFWFCYFCFKYAEKYMWKLWSSPVVFRAMSSSLVTCSCHSCNPAVQDVLKKKHSSLLSWSSPNLSLFTPHAPHAMARAVTDNAPKQSKGTWWSPTFVTLQQNVNIRERYGAVPFESSRKARKGQCFFSS